MTEMNELELEKQKYPIVFYCMAGCYYCQMANNALDPEIKSKIIGKFAHTDEPPAGVQGFPHFVNNRNKKTVTGWPGSKEELFLQLGYKVEKFKEDYPESIENNTCYKDCWKKLGGPDGKQRGVIQMSPLFYTRYYGCTEAECDAKVTQPVIPKVTQPVIPKVGQSQECSKVCAQECSKVCANKCNKREGFSENFEMESVPSYPVVNYIETIPPDIHYYHHTGGGYSKLSNCWAKRPDFTA